MSRLAYLTLLLVIGAVVVMGKRGRGGKSRDKSSGSSSSDEDKKRFWVKNGDCFDDSLEEAVSMLDCDAGKDLQSSVVDLYSIIESLNETLGEHGTALASLRADVDSLLPTNPTVQFIDEPVCSSICDSRFKPSGTLCLPVLVFNDGTQALTCSPSNGGDGSGSGESNDLPAAFADAYCQELGLTLSSVDTVPNNILSSISFPSEYSFMSATCGSPTGSDFLDYVDCLTLTDVASCGYLVVAQCSE